MTSLCFSQTSTACRLGRLNSGSSRGATCGHCILVVRGRVSGLSGCSIESLGIVFSATDIASFLACRHTATLARAESKNEITKPFFKNPSVDLLRTLGQEHEQRYLRELSEKDGWSIAQIAIGGGNWKDAVAETVEALRRGVDAVYQRTFLDGQWGGRSDFLIRVNTSSALGSWSYEVVETKLARSTKATALIQLCFYSDLLARIQGTEPQWMHVVLGGTSAPERFQVQRYIAYFRKVRGEFETAWKTERNTYPEPVEHCEVCSWFSLCDTRRRADDHPSLVAGISRNQRKALAGRDVKTVAALAKLALPPKPKIERIGDAALLRIREQARLQVQGRDVGRLVYELLDGVENGNGLAALPLPSPSDMFLDLEANPYVLDQGLEYLVGRCMITAVLEPKRRFRLASLTWGRAPGTIAATELTPPNCPPSFASFLFLDQRQPRYLCA
jgi:predicted RecB family nuclease